MIKCKVCHYITQKANQINNKKIYKEKRMKFLNMLITIAFKIHHITKKSATVTTKPKLNHLHQIIAVTSKPKLNHLHQVKESNKN